MIQRRTISASASPCRKALPVTGADGRFDQRGVGFDIRRHGEDILGEEAVILCKHLQKLIMEDLDLGKIQVKKERYVSNRVELQR
jgi:hypothetical protein